MVAILERRAPCLSSYLISVDVREELRHEPCGADDGEDGEEEVPERHQGFYVVSTLLDEVLGVESGGWRVGEVVRVGRGERGERGESLVDARRACVNGRMRLGSWVAVTWDIEDEDQVGAHGKDRQLHAVGGRVRGRGSEASQRARVR